MSKISKTVPEGTFSSGGNTPELYDSRLKFIICWFQKSISIAFKSVESVDQIVLHHDADLYTSTLYCLAKTEHLLKLESTIIVDDCANIMRLNEAFRNYKLAFTREFRLICSAPRLTTVAFEVNLLTYARKNSEIV